MQQPLPSLASLSTALLRNGRSLQTKDHTDLAHIFKTLSVGMNGGSSSAADELVPLSNPPMLYPHTEDPHDGADGVLPMEAPQKDPLRTALRIFDWPDVFDTNSKTLNLPPLEKLTREDLKSIIIKDVPRDPHKYVVLAVNTKTVPWQKDLKLPDNQRRCIITWRQVLPSEGSQSKKQLKMQDDVPLFEPWMMITESAALKRINVPKAPHGIDANGLYMLKDLKPLFDKKRRALHSVQKEVLGYYSGRVRHTWPSDHDLSDIHNVKEQLEDRVRPYGSKDLILYHKDRIELVDSATHELPPFLSFANDPLFTKQEPNAIMNKTGELTTWSDGVGGGRVRYPKPFDFSKSLDENVDSEILWDYDGVSSWNGGESYWEGIFSREELDAYKRQQQAERASKRQQKPHNGSGYHVSDDSDDSDEPDDSNDEDYEESSSKKKAPRKKDPVRRSTRQPANP